MFTTLSIFNTLHPIIARTLQVLGLPTRNKPKGRKTALDNVDAVTIAILKQTQNINTKKAWFQILQPPCTYKTFVETINRIGVTLARVVAVVMQIARRTCHWLKFTDATELPVCLLKNAKRHKTMKLLASKSKSSKGWFYGLKLHLTADFSDTMLALKFTTATSNDRAVFKDINAELDGQFVVDAGYVSKQLTKDFHIDGERSVLTCSRSNMKTLSTPEQIHLLNLRMHIEKHFRMMKTMCGMCSTMPRSINGVLVQYLAAVVAHLLTPRSMSLPLLKLV
jgi:hypothetical protein